MSATYTHHLFTQDVYKSLDINIKEKLDLDIFNLFGKSFDALFFYKPKLGKYAHNHEVNLYFANIIYYLREYHETRNRELLSYLYGSICHYIMDSTIHPFIYYYGGKYEKSKKATHKYRGSHDYLELMIDAIMANERNGKKIYKSKIGKEVFPKIKFTSNLKSALDQVYLDTFHVVKGSKIYLKGYRNYKFIFKHGMQSRWGIKKIVYRFIDAIHVIPSIKLQNFCYHVPKLDYTVLNLEHKKWYYPVDKKLSFHYSFYDLYDVALVRAKKIITLLDQVIDQDEIKVKRAIKEIGNLSYGTGVSEKRKVTMKYFVN